MALLLLSSSAAAFVYDESVEGDLPRNEGAPLAIGTLDEGANFVLGSAPFDTDFGDSFSVELAPGHEIEAVEIAISGHTGGFTARGRIFETPDFSNIESRTFTEDGSAVYTAPPLEGGPFGFSAVYQSGGADGDHFDWEWKITVPEPGGSALGIGALATLGALARRRARRGRRSRERPDRPDA